MNVKIIITGSPSDITPAQRQKLRRISNVLRADGFTVDTEFTEEPTKEESRYLPQCRYDIRSLMPSDTITLKHY